MRTTILFLLLTFFALALKAEEPRLPVLGLCLVKKTYSTP